MNNDKLNETDPLRDLLAEAEHAVMFSRVASACEAGGHHSCRGRAANLIDNLPPATADLLRAVLADPEASRDGLALRSLKGSGGFIVTTTGDGRSYAVARLPSYRWPNVRLLMGWTTGPTLAVAIAAAQEAER